MDQAPEQKLEARSHAFQELVISPEEKKEGDDLRTLRPGLSI